MGPTKPKAAEMGRSYNLICRDCGMTMSVGAVYWQYPDGKPMGDVTCAGVYSRLDKIVHRRDAMFAHVVERFLIIHRNHNLTFVPDGVDDVLDGVIPNGPYVDADDVLALPVDPLPDPAEELKLWIRKWGMEGDPRFRNLFDE